MDVKDIIEEIIKPQIKQPLWESWYIKEKIGSGAFSVVYKIEADRSYSIDVSALKIEAITTEGKIFTDIARKASVLENRRKMADNEMKIMKSLRDCPYIVRYEEEHMKELYINGSFEGYYCLIRMEYLQNVYEKMNQGEFDYSETNVRKLALEIGQGLKAAHDINVIHRDIKPENFFISDKGIYKLGDFNISKQAASTRSFAGTNYYMAPEVYRAKASVDESYTKQADIYSFGLCLYQMMNDGLLPFEETLTSEEAIDKRFQGEPPSPPKNASSDFGRVILKACTFHTWERYGSIDEMLADLENMSEYKEGEKEQNISQIQHTTMDEKAYQTQYAEDDSMQEKHSGYKSVTKIGRKAVIVVLAAVIVIAAVSIFAVVNRDKKSERISTTAAKKETSSKNESVSTEEEKTTAAEQETSSEKESVSTQEEIIHTGTGYSLRAPESWVDITSEEDTFDLCLAYTDWDREDDNMPPVYIISVKLEDISQNNQGLDNYWYALLRVCDRLDYEITDTNRGHLDVLDAYQIEYKTTEGKNNYVLQFVTLKDDTIYRFTFHADEEGYQKLYREARKIITTVVFTTF